MRSDSRYLLQLNYLALEVYVNIGVLCRGSSCLKTSTTDY